MRNLQAIKAEWKNDPPRPACEVINYLCDLATGLAQERDALKLEAADCAENHYSAEEGRALEAERDSLRSEVKSLNEELSTAIATSRALAFEEAARWHDGMSKAANENDIDQHERGLTPDGSNSELQATHDYSAGQIRTLAPLPPTLVAVPVDALARVREHVEAGRKLLRSQFPCGIVAASDGVRCTEPYGHSGCHKHYDGSGPMMHFARDEQLVEDDAYKSTLDTALALLDSVKP